MTNEAIKQQDVNNAAWAACDTFRGVMDAAGYKDYILVMLFLKYISDVATASPLAVSSCAPDTSIKRLLTRFNSLPICEQE
ncbi:MAG: hypothetical protein CL570_03620 [Alphaproteobacteria bacterium]|nr:hypothetical protein [Alphaproteobacteria bacterium]|tara:strand:+ start:1989 stop:2231 length:243 start_codon:yes stop_codon:yes gene_type:complete